jgi:hypothetical protein
MASAGLIAIAALLAFPEWSAPVSLAILAAALMGLAIRADNRWLSHGALVMLGAGTLALAFSGSSSAEFHRLLWDDLPTSPGIAVLRWMSIAASATGLAWILGETRRGVHVQWLAALLAYGTLAQLIPAGWLAMTSALIVLALAEKGARLPLTASRRWTHSLHWRRCGRSIRWAYGCRRRWPRWRAIR